MEQGARNKKVSHQGWNLRVLGNRMISINGAERGDTERGSGL